MNRRQYWAALILIVGGAVLLVPALYEGLVELSGGYMPHMIVGVFSFVAAALLLKK